MIERIKRAYNYHWPWHPYSGLAGGCTFGAVVMVAGLVIRFGVL